MSYNSKQLTRLNGVGYVSGDSKSIWAYASADPLATIIASGYFDLASKRLRKGDIVHVMASLGGTVESATVQVTSATGAVPVTVKSAGVMGDASVKIASGQATTATASDTIATGLATVVGVVASLNDAPVAGCQFVTADIGNQSGAPAAGSFLLKSWKATAAGDTAQVAATTFSKKVNWIAFGT